MAMVVESMEMAPGAIPRPGRVPEQRLLSPELGFLVAAAQRNSSLENDFVVGLNSSGGIFRRKGEGGRASRAPHPVLARQKGWPRWEVVWAPRGPPPSPLRCSGTSRGK